MKICNNNSPQRARETVSNSDAIGIALGFIPVIVAASAFTIYLFISIINVYATDEEKLRNDIIVAANSQIGKPYHYGGKTPEEGFDCSGLVQYVYGKNGIKLPRSAAEQFEQGTNINLSDAKPGDLVFYKNEGEIASHVCIYVDTSHFIDAPKTAYSQAPKNGLVQIVEKKDMDEDYGNQKFAGVVTYIGINEKSVK